MSSIKLFESKRIRTVWNEADEKWYFVVADVIHVLTESPNPSDYIKKMRKRDGESSKWWEQFVTPLYIETAGGKQQVNCVNAQGVLYSYRSLKNLQINQHLVFLYSHTLFYSYFFYNPIRWRL